MPNPMGRLADRYGRAKTLAAALIGLGPLANNGGPTPTIALLPGSLAIDHGDDAVIINPLTRLTTDQRGLSRRAGAHVDIGAFEAGAGPLTSRSGGRRNGLPVIAHRGIWPGMRAAVRIAQWAGR